MGNRIYQIANDSKSLGEQVASEKRTHYCGSLRAENAEQKVVLKGWVETRRDHGNLIFLDIRDREGFVQVVVNPNEASMSSAKNVRNEYVVSLTGEVQLRPEGLQNKGLPTGAVEVHASQFEILSEAQTPPFQASDANVGENLRLKYRYLDLRSPRLHKNFKIRHKTTQLVRQFLDEQSFLEIETPILYKSTPEGARDYLVPSRVHPGSFYALPQSPQTLKQLLMIAGYDRYFQIARCFRDEDLRADRQPEFSQIDIEMSFVETEDIIEVNERLLRKLWKEIRGQEVPEIPHMTYDQAMEEYGCDRPDLRFDMKLIALNNFFKGCGFKVFEDVIDRAAAIKGIVAPGVASYSRGQMDKVTKLAQAAGAKGLVWIKKKDGKFQSTVGKFFDDEKLSQLFDHCGAGDGDAIFIVADESAVTCGTLSTLRLHFGKELSLIDEKKDAFVWVTDFPLFDYDAEQKRWVACHHPFTCCKKKPERKVFPRTVRKNRKSLENDREKDKKKEGFTLWGWITGTIEYADLDEVRKEIGDHYLIEINSGEEAFLNYLENRYFGMESEEKERVEIFLESHFPEDEVLFRIKTGG